MKHRVYVPKLPLVFDTEGRLLLFEVSNQMKRIPLFTVPSYFLSLASCVIMVDAFAAMSVLKGCLFAFPFMTFLVFSTYMTQQSSNIVQRIELLKDKELGDSVNKKKDGEKDEEERSGDEDVNTEDQYAEEVLIENLRGEIARINVSEIKPLNTEVAKQFILQ